MGTASTAPLAGGSRIRRRISLRKAVGRAFGPCVGGQPGTRERKAFWRFALTIPVANLCGAIDVFLFLWYVMPLPEVANHDHMEHVNAIAFAITILVTFFTCGALSNAVAEPIADWLDSG